MRREPCHGNVVVWAWSWALRHLELQTYDPANPRGPYLGQKPPGMIPRVFAPGFISSASGVEYSITFSPDGNEIYFSRYAPADETETTWVTRQVNGVWTPPARADFADGIRDTEPFIMPDGTRMFFVSIRSGGPQSTQIWSMTRGAGGWTVPVRLGSPFSTSAKMYPTAAGNGNLYFTEEVSGTRRRFLMARPANGAFTTPTPLSPTVNAFNSMGHTFIAADESTIVFDVAPDGQSYYLYVSFRGSNTDWLPPIRLNNDVNAVANVTCPAISPDGKYLFFQRGGDIWWVDARVVLDLRLVNTGSR
jgi:Tol biopolymer transport system component